MQEVFFSNRAYIAILKETQVHISTETGGILLGRVDGDKWYIVESLDPGPKSVFLTTYFEYDHKYLEHLISKINYLYEKPLRIMGLWHRHPGSFNVFSTTDDGTNYKFAQLNKEGAISALINIEPETMLTVYHVTGKNNKVAYSKVKYKVGDEFIPSEYRNLASAEKTIQELDEYKNRPLLRSLEKRETFMDFSQVIKSFQSSNEELAEHPVSTLHVLSDIDLDNLLKILEEDFIYFSSNAIEYKLKKVDSCLHVIIENDTGDEKTIDLCFAYEPTNEKAYLILNENKVFRYESGSLKKHAINVNSKKAVTIGEKIWQRITKEIKSLFQLK